MKPVLPLLCFSALVANEELATAYDSGTSYRVARETRISMETTEFSFERDGEPMDRGGFGGGGGTESSKTIVILDQVVEALDGHPAEVHRTFEQVEGTASMFGNDMTLDSPLAGKTLELTLEGDEVVVELADGESVDDDALLEGHRLTLALDALLPEESIAAGDTWEIEGEALLHALGLDVEQKLFERPEPPEFGGGRGGGGGRGRGRGGRGGSDSSTLFAQAEWDVTATLLERTEELAGEECLVISIEAEGSGEVEAPARRGGSREFAPRTGSSNSRPMRGTEFTIELEGELFFSSRASRPVQLEVEAEIEVRTDNEFQRGDSVMRMKRTQEGTLEQTVTVTGA